MKKTNKLLAFLLAFVMLFSLAIVPASAVDFNDVPENYQYYDAIQSLVVRGIINGYAEDNTFRPEATITRAEFCKMVIYSLGLSNLASGAVTDSGFPDVAANHWAAGNIQMAYKMGIINGFEDGTFRAEQNVTYEQAVKMVVCATSEELAQLATLNGGFPKGYMAVAKSTGLIKDIYDGVDAAPAKRGTIAKLVDNMLKTDLSGLAEGKLPGEPGGSSSGSIVGSDGVVEVSGQIVTVYGATILDNGDSVKKEQVKLELADGSSAIYSIEDLSIKNNMYDFLGKMVTVYYKQQSMSTQVLTNLSLQRRKNDEVTVNFIDILPDYTKTSVYYDNGEEEEELSVPSDAVIMFNGRRTDKAFNALLDEHINKSGSIRFLSTQNDGDYDVVFFTVYDSMYVTNVNNSTKVVTGEGGKKYKIDEDDSTKLISVYKDGKAVEASTIKSGQVISVAESLDQKVLEVRISTKTPDGVVSATDVISDNKPASKVTVNNKTYTYIAGIEPIEDTGINVKLYVDAFDKIVKYELKAASVDYTYAYMLTFANANPEGMQNSVGMRVINLNTTKVDDTYYRVADRVTINGKNYDMPADYDQALTAIKTAAALYSLSGGAYELKDGEVYQPIKYALKDNKVNNILIGKPINEVTNADIKIDTVALNTAIKCTKPGVTLGGIHNLNSSTKVLVLPADRSDAEAYEIRVGTQSGFVSGSSYNVLFVDENKSGTSPLVIVYGGGSLLKTNKWLNAVPGIVLKKGSDTRGNILQVLTHKGTVEYIDETTKFYSMAEKGDIIRVLLDDQNYIENLEVVVDAEAFYAGDEFIKIPDRAGDYASFAGDKVTSRRIGEGEYKTADNAQFAMLAGTALELREGTNLLLGLEFAAENKTLDQTELGSADPIKLYNYGITGAKIYVVEFDSEGKVASGSISTEAVAASELDSYTYKYMNKDADKVFVYTASSRIEMIVVFRAQKVNN